MGKGKSTSRLLKISGASCVGNTIIGTGKLVMGLLSSSVFACAGAMYTFAMVGAKLTVLAGIREGDDNRGECRRYRTAGWILVVASVLYIIYSIGLYISPPTTQYHPYIAIGIAAFTFAELALNLRGVIVERNSKTVLVHAIRMINLASTLICLVLTRTALLSFTTLIQGSYSGEFGIVMGGAAMMLGIIMVARITYQEKRMDAKKTY